MGRRWWADEMFCCRGKEKRSLYRAIDQHGQVMDGLLREKRDRARAEAFFRRALRQTGVMPTRVVSDHHQPYVKAVAVTVPTACHIRTGVHRARGDTTKAIERSHVATRDRLRCSRGVKTLRTGQRFLESFEGLQASRGGYVKLREVVPRYRPTRASRHERARAAVKAIEALGQGLTKIRCPEIL